MRKLTKTTLVFALSIVAMFSCVLGLTLNGKTVKAESITVTQVEGVTDITTTPFEMSNVQIRLDLEDTKENGIRFVASANRVALSDVVYGMVITAYKNADLTTENLFGENAKYTFVREEANEDISYAVKYELGAEDVAELGGYLIVSLRDFSEEQIDKGLTAVCYLKNINEEGKLVYDVKEGEISTSMQEVALSAIDKTQGETKVALLDTYVGEADEEAYKAFAGYYTDAYKFDYNEETKEANATITTVGVYDTKGHDKETKATYKLYKNGTFVINTDEIIFGTYNDGVKVNDLAISKVDIETLRGALGGDLEGGLKAYGKTNAQLIYPYSDNQLRFYNYYNLQKGSGSDASGSYEYEGYNGDLLGSSFKFYWDLIPITENSGLIYTAQKNSLSSTNFNHWVDISMGVIYYTYNPANGYMNLRYSGELIDKFGTQVPYNHFVDMPWTTHYTPAESNQYPPVNTNGHFDTAKVFDKLSSDAFGSKYVAESGATLVLGAMESVFEMSSSKVQASVLGGRLTLDDNENEVNGTYNVVSSVADGSKGFFFVDMSETASMYHKVEDKTRFARGTYAINGEEINVSFTYNGVDYSFDYVAPAEVEQSVYDAFAGTYTDTYVFNADKSVTRRDLNNYDSTSGNKYSSETVKFIDNGGYKPVTGAGGARYWYKTATYTHSGYNPTETGSYILLNNGVIEITFNNDTVYGIYEDGKFTVDEKAYTEVDMDTLYNDLTKVTAGYKDANSYSSTALKFTKDTGTGYFGNWYSGQGGAQNWTFDYNIIPITENFGKIEAFMTGGQTGYTGSEYGVNVDGVYKDKDGNVVDATTATLVNNISLYDFGKSVAEIYYAYENGEFRLSVSSGVSTSRGLRPTYNHFTDYTADKALVNGEALYTSLAKSYTGEKTLVLSGLTDLKSGTAVGTAVTGGFKGGYGTFDGNVITYSLIKLNETSGKIFFDMTATPQSYTGRADKTTFCQGDYVIDGSNITITFTYAGTTYTVTYTA